MSLRNLCPVCLQEIPRFFRRGIFCSRTCERRAKEGR